MRFSLKNENYSEVFNFSALISCSESNIFHLSESSFIQEEI